TGNVRVTVFDQRTGEGIAAAPVAVFVAPDDPASTPPAIPPLLTATGGDGSVVVDLSVFGVPVTAVDVHAGVPASGLMSFFQVPASEVAMGFAPYPIDPALGVASPSVALALDVTSAGGDPVVILSGYDFERKGKLPFQIPPVTGSPRSATLALESGFRRF